MDSGSRDGQRVWDVGGGKSLPARAQAGWTEMRVPHLPPSLCLHVATTYLPPHLPTQAPSVPSPCSSSLLVHSRPLALLLHSSQAYPPPHPLQVCSHSPLLLFLPISLLLHLFAAAFLCCFGSVLSLFVCFVLLICHLHTLRFVAFPALGSWTSLALAMSPTLSCDLS